MKKRADGRYQLSIMVGYNSNGTPKRKVVYGKSQKEVNEKANELRMYFNMGLAIGNDITVGEWAETWLKTYKCGVEYNTQKMYKVIVNNYLIKPLGGLKLKDVKTAHLQHIVNENESKSWVVKKFRLTVNQIMEQAIINDLIIKNPAKGIKLPVINKKQGKRALTEIETAKIKKLALDDKTNFFVNLLLYTGMRRGEALAITKSDINLERMEISVNKTLVFVANQSVVKPTPKTNAGFRNIPILEPFRKTLIEYVNSIDTDMLFVTSSGNSFSETAYRRMWGKFVKAMDTKEITAHIFRHNFATILYNAEVDLKSAQYILGHSNISVTMDVYTHLNNQKKSEATNKLNEFLTKLD
jgi:integrase